MVNEYTLSREWPELNDLRADLDREERRRHEERERERRLRAERLVLCRELLEGTDAVHLLRLMNEHLLSGRGVVEQSEEQLRESSAAARLRWLGPERDDGTHGGESLEIAVIAATTPEGEAFLSVLGDSTVARGVRTQAELKGALIRAVRHPGRLGSGQRPAG
ncbi:MAG: hypothetical protein ACRDJ9_35710 [Dehalococcoidia bacterium]